MTVRKRSESYGPAEGGLVKPLSRYTRDGGPADANPGNPCRQAGRPFGVWTKPLARRTLRVRRARPAG